MFAEDIDVFFDPDGLADTGVVNGVDINGIFSNEFVDTFETSSTKPVFYIPETELSRVAVGNAITIKSKAYTVEVEEPPQDGVVRLILSEQ
ncbi:MAG: hypothetical protein AAF542_17855 [Pseudomonadota bacterium]